MPSVTVQSHRPFRVALLAGTSALALMLAGIQPALARMPGGPANGSSIPGVAAGSSQSASEQAAAIAKQSQASMLRATQALQAAQNAARAAAAGAASNGVTNGLSAGGLVVDQRRRPLQ